MRLLPEHTYVLDLLAARPVPREELEGVLQGLGFGDVAFELFPPEPYVHRFACSPQKLLKLSPTPDLLWGEPWETLLHPLDPIRVPDTPLLLEPGKRYDLRVLAKTSSRDLLRVLLGRVGILTVSPIIPLRTHIRHPGLGGDLTDTLLRVETLPSYRESEGVMLIEEAIPWS